MKNNYISRKDKIVIAAIDIIDELGVQSLSSKNIAARENISEALIYKHFKSLQEIILEVVKTYVKFDNSIINTLINKDISNKEKIQEFFEMYGVYYENYPAITAVSKVIEHLLHYEEAKEIICNSLKNNLEFLEEVIKDGLANNEFKTVFEPRELSTVLIGNLEMIVSIWRISDKSYKLTDKINDSIKKIVDTALTE